MSENATGDASAGVSLLCGVTARVRVIVDNDFSGDPDDLFQLAHHVLSPSCEIQLVVASHLPVGDHLDPSGTQADNAAAIATDLLARLGRQDLPVVAGSNTALSAEATHHRSAAVDAIIAEAMRDDPRPLFYCAGAGLTDLASALAVEPRIATRLTLIWIGGEDHEGLTASPERSTRRMEFNLSIDVRAARLVFQEDELEIWQVPRGTYLMSLASFAELDARVAASGELGAYLVSKLRELVCGIDPHYPAWRGLRPGRSGTGAADGAARSLRPRGQLEPVHRRGSTRHRNGRFLRAAGHDGKTSGVHGDRHPAHVRGLLREARPALSLSWCSSRSWPPPPASRGVMPALTAPGTRTARR